ncbi:iron-containing redox enzyme family protein [Streptomyces sp. NPDC058301]|uniref:iron-containing redox enzyme family protein n=1 Tax=Streptomyces sp. NPDC058301 TaxID=3346436 RepID=UPI0036ED0E00
MTQMDTEGPISRHTSWPADVAAAFPRGDAAPDPVRRGALLRGLHRYYLAYLAGPESFHDIPRLNTDARVAATEQAWLAWEDARVDADALPVTADAFRDWFLRTAAGHVQAEFCRYLAEDATLPEIALFFLAEELVDSKFDDLVALVQLGTTGATKLTIAENYWDEMGRGSPERVHTRLFERSAQYMRKHLATAGAGIGLQGEHGELQVPEVYENACLPLMYGIHRHLVPRALGAMGLMEQSAPPRFQAMVEGCERLGVPEDVIEYQRVHVHVDADHGAEWLEGVFTPLVADSPAVLREIAMGVATRVRVADAYYRCVRQRMREVAR